MSARILVVEDNPLNLKLIGTCWSSGDSTCSRLSPARRALRWRRASRPTWC